MGAMEKLNIVQWVFLTKQLGSSIPSCTRTMASQLSEHKFSGLLKLVEHFLCLRKAMKEL